MLLSSSSPIPDLEAFLRWVEATPHLLRLVDAHMQTVDRALSSTALFDLIAGRDAANYVHMLARGAGFHGVADAMYEAYEAFCRVLNLIQRRRPL